VCDIGPLVAAALSLQKSAIGSTASVPHLESPVLALDCGWRFYSCRVTIADYARVAELVAQYGSLPLGIADATVVAVAERLKLTDTPSPC
jgi:hypothetical protein